MKSFIGTLKKSKRIPFHQIENEEKEQKITAEFHAQQMFWYAIFSPAVKTVKPEKSVETLFDSEELSKVIHKNRYQVQKIEVFRQ